MSLKPIFLAIIAALGLSGAKIVGGDPQTGAILGAAGNVIYCQENPSKC